MTKTRRRFVHDSECALSQSWTGAVPSCTCRERQASRKRRKSTYRSGSVEWGDFMQGKDPIGNGNFRTRSRHSD